MAALIMDRAATCTAQRQRAAASTDGTVFELAEGSGTITTLASFNDTDGADPRAGLIMDSSGNLYGTTSTECLERRHGFRAGQGQRHDHHAGFVQRRQRRKCELLV